MNPEIINQAKKRENIVKERGETKLFSLASEKIDAIKPEIMVGARDMGMARFLAPVMEELLGRGYPVALLTDQPAEKFLQDKFTKMKEVRVDFSLGAIAQRQPGLILSGISSSGGPGIEFYLAKTAEGYGEEEVKRIPCVWVEDYWGTATDKRHLAYEIKPDIICAFDQYSKNLDAAHLQEAKIDKPSADQIIITGSPAFDEIAREENRQAIQQKLHESLKIADDEIFLAWMGALPPADLANLKILIANLNAMELGGKKIVLTARIHPQVLSGGSLAQYQEEYEQLLNIFLQGRLVETMGKFTTDEVAIAADIIMSESSTEGVKAVYRGKPALFMLLPGLGRDSLKKNSGMETLPVIDSGASIGVFRQEDMKESLEKLLNPAYQKTMRQAQLEHHRLDGQNTIRVVDAVEKLLSHVT